jgi:hypothetical protein
MRPSRPDELTDHHVVHTYHVWYPSARRMTLRGVSGMLVTEGGAWSPTVRLVEHAEDVGELMVLDPRAVITRDGLVIYEPRRYPGRNAWVDAWLCEHPEWPRIALDTVAAG